MSRKTPQVSPGLQVLMRESFDSLDAFQQAHAGWNLRFQQLEAGKLSAHSLQVSGASTIFTRSGFNRSMHQQGASPPGMLTFGLIHSTYADITWCGQQASDATVECFDASGSFDAVTQCGFDVFTLAVATDRVQALQNLHNMDGPSYLATPTASVLYPGNACMADIRQLLQQLLSALEHTAQGNCVGAAQRLLEEELPLALINALRTDCADPPKPSSPARRRAREQAVTYMHDNVRNGVSIAAICEDIGVSWRLLDYAFKDYYGVSPKAYMKMLCLDGLRTDLQKAGPEATVTVLAGDWGFSHFGQLALDYRKRFGERPSDTLQKTS